MSFTTARSARTELALGAAVSVAALALYVRTLAPTVLPGDSGEFQFAVPALGVVHPTGYPLYLLLAKLLTLILPIGDIAYRVNAFSALTMASAAGVTAVIAYSLLRAPIAFRLLSGVLAGGLFAVSYEAWSQAVIAEVYGLQMLLLAVAVLGAIRRWPIPVLATILGLALAHHRTIVLAAPFIAIYMLLDQSPVQRLLTRRNVILSALGLGLPLLLYAYIPLRAPASPYLNQVTASGQSLTVYDGSVNAFIDEVTGRVFANKLGTGESAGLPERWDLFVRLLSRQWQTVTLLLLGIGAGAFASLHRKQAVLLGGIGIGTLLFGLLYRIGDIEVYFIPTYWVLSIVGGWIAAWLVGVAAAINRSVTLTLAAGVVLAAGLIANTATVNLPKLDRSGETGHRQRWEATLSQPLERKAMLASDDRDDLTPLWYFQLAEGVRPDLLGVFPGMLEKPEFGDVGRLLDTLLRPGETMYLIKEMPGIDVKVNVAPSGPPFRVLGPAATGQPGTPLSVRVGEDLQLAGVSAPRTVPTTSLTVRLWWTVGRQPKENLTSFVHVIDWQGKLIAQHDALPGGVYYPTSRWRPGEQLVDTHLLSLPDTTPAGRYTLRAGLYDTDLKRLKVGDDTAADIATVRVVRQVRDQPAQAVNIRFPGVGSVTGVTTSASGDVRIFWKAEGPTDRPLTVFLHLLDSDGRLVRQADGPPAGGALPTDSWLPDEIVLDARQLPDFGRLPPGQYRLVAGLYEPTSGARRLTEGGADAAELGLIRAN